MAEPTLSQMRREHDAKIEKAVSAYSKQGKSSEDVAGFKAELKRQSLEVITEEHDRRVATTVEKHRAQQDANPLLKYIETPIAAVLSVLNKGTAEALPTLAGAVSAIPSAIAYRTGMNPSDATGAVEAFDRTKENVGLAVDAAERIAPIPSAIGGIAGIVSKATPVGAALRGVGMLGRATVGRGAEIASRVSPEVLGKIPIVRANAAAAQKVLTVGAQAAAAYLTSGAAIGAENLMRYTTDDRDIRKVVDDSVKAINSPTNIMLSLGVGSLGGLYRRPADTEWMETLKRLGVKETPAEMRPNSETSQWFANQLSKMPFIRTHADKIYREAWLEPLTKSIKSTLGRLRGSVSEGRTEATAAMAIRDVPKKIEALRSEKQSALFGEFGQQELPRKAFDAIGRSVAADLSGWAAPTKGSMHGAQAGDIFEKIQRIVGKGDSAVQLGGGARPAPTYQEMWDLYDGLRDMSQARTLAKALNIDATISAQDARVARKLAFTIRQGFKEASSDFDRGIHSLELLREFGRRWKPIEDTINMNTLPSEVTTAFFRPEGLIGRLRSIKSFTPEHESIVTAEYLKHWIETVSRTVTADGVTSTKTLAKTMDNLWHTRGSIFYGNTFRRVLGQEAMDYWKDIGSVQSRFDLYLGRAAGSPTAARGAEAIMVGAAMKAPEMLTNLISDAAENPGIVAQTGRAITGLILYGTAKSMLGGGLAKALTTLSAGRPVSGPVKSSVAWDQEGGQVKAQADRALGQLGTAASNLAPGAQ